MGFCYIRYNIISLTFLSCKMRRYFSAIVFWMRCSMCILQQQQQLTHKHIARTKMHLPQRRLNGDNGNNKIVCETLWNRLKFVNGNYSEAEALDFPHAHTQHTHTHTARVLRCYKTKGTRYKINLHRSAPSRYMFSWKYSRVFASIMYSRLQFGRMNVCRKAKRKRWRMNGCDVPMSEWSKAMSFETDKNTRIK